MAILDTNKRPLVNDRDELVFIGIDLPFRKSDGVEGYFASTNYTLDAVKNNIKLFCQTKKGERLMQPSLGISLHKYLFEQFTDETRISIENDIVNDFNIWFSFITIRDIRISFDSDADYDVGRNKMNIYIEFNLNSDPRTTESVQIDIGD
jgi:phage baseplate assembly protein W